MDNKYFTNISVGVTDTGLDSLLGKLAATTSSIEKLNKLQIAPKILSSTLGDFTKAAGLEIKQLVKIKTEVDKGSLENSRKIINDFFVKNSLTTKLNLDIAPLRAYAAELNKLESAREARRARVYTAQANRFNTTGNDPTNPRRVPYITQKPFTPYREDNIDRSGQGRRFLSPTNLPEDVAFRQFQQSITGRRAALQQQQIFAQKRIEQEDLKLRNLLDQKATLSASLRESASASLEKRLLKFKAQNDTIDLIPLDIHYANGLNRIKTNPITEDLLRRQTASPINDRINNNYISKKQREAKQKAIPRQISSIEESITKLAQALPLAQYEVGVSEDIIGSTPINKRGQSARGTQFRASKEVLEQRKNIVAGIQKDITSAEYKLIDLGRRSSLLSRGKSEPLDQADLRTFYQPTVTGYATRPGEPAPRPAIAASTFNRLNPQELIDKAFVDYANRS